MNRARLGTVVGCFRLLGVVAPSLTCCTLGGTESLGTDLLRGAAGSFGVAGAAGANSIGDGGAGGSGGASVAGASGEEAPEADRIDFIEDPSLLSMTARWGVFVVVDPGAEPPSPIEWLLTGAPELWLARAMYMCSGGPPHLMFGTCSSSQGADCLDFEVDADGIVSGTYFDPAGRPNSLVGELTGRYGPGGSSYSSDRAAETVVWEGRFQGTATGTGYYRISGEFCVEVTVELTIC